MESLIENSKDLALYHKDKEKKDDKGEGIDQDCDVSLGEISSADEFDMKQLLSGEHTFQFEA